MYPPPAARSKVVHYPVQPRNAKGAHQSIGFPHQVMPQALRLGNGMRDLEYPMGVPLYQALWQDRDQCRLGLGSAPGLDLAPGPQEMIFDGNGRWRHGVTWVGRFLHYTTTPRRCKPDLIGRLGNGTLPGMTKSPTPTRRLPFLFWVGVFMTVVGGAGWVALRFVDPAPAPMDIINIQVDGVPYEVEVAKTQPQQIQGLMFRDHLDPGRGMLFLSHSETPGPRVIWMKNTKIPLDVLFFDVQGVLVDMHQSVPPCLADPCPTYPSSVPATYILELAAGQVAAHGFSVGDQMTKSQGD